MAYTEQQIDSASARKMAGEQLTHLLAQYEQAEAHHRQLTERLMAALHDGIQRLGQENERMRSDLKRLGVETDTASEMPVDVRAFAQALGNAAPPWHAR